MMSNPRGYSYDFVQEVMAAKNVSLGVRLGRVCIKKRVPVSYVSYALGVTRHTVYSWFTGKFNPSSENVVKIEKLLAKLAN